MKQILFCLVLVFTVAAAKADLVMELNFGSPKLKVIANIKDDKIRYDILPDGGYGKTSRIADLKTGDDFNLDYPPKRIIRNQTNATAQIAWPNFQDTGKAENISGYEAEIYNATNSNGGIETLWVAKSFPNFEKIKNDLAKLDKLHIGNWLPKFSSLSGMPLKLALPLNGPNGMTAFEVSRSLTSPGRRLFDLGQTFFDLGQRFFDLEKWLFLPTSRFAVAAPSRIKAGQNVTLAPNWQVVANWPTADPGRIKSGHLLLPKQFAPEIFFIKLRAWQTRSFIGLKPKAPTRRGCFWHCSSRRRS
jgi:hypothetical protein